MKILCITPIDHIPGVKELLSSLGELIINPDPSNEDINNIEKEFDIIFTNPNKSKIFIGRELFADWNYLICVCTASTGTVHVDKAFLKLVPGTKNVPHTTIEKAGHFLQEDNPEDCVKAILSIF